MRRLLQITLILILTIHLSFARAAATSETIQPIRDEKTLQILSETQKRVEEIRGLHYGNPIPTFYLTSENLRNIVMRESGKQYPEPRRKADEALLKSLQIVPPTFDMQKMVLALLDEQVAGLYDEETRRLYVRAGLDIVKSHMARMVLAHEMCHALQDHAFKLKSLGVEAVDNDDFSLAGMTVAEGDAMLLTSEYVEKWASPELVKEIPAAFFMDQSALNNTPLFFRDQLMFPYIQGQLVLTEAKGRGTEWRNRLFTDPPQTTAQVIHTEKYFNHREGPSSITLLLPANSHAVVPGAPPMPAPPQGYRRVELNRFGELGTRLLFEDCLGTGMAYAAAEGWRGDGYEIYNDGKAKWWFCWESAWETPRDAKEFTGAWITLWRTVERKTNGGEKTTASEKKIGDLDASEQTFQSGEWTVFVKRVDQRVVVWWRN